MFRNLGRNKKAIDTILASLLMVVIVVAASVMVFVYATGLFGALTQAPNLQKEALSLEFSSFGPNNPTYNVSLYLRNTGSAPITLVSYYVKNSNSSQYAKTTWTGQTTIAPTALTNPPVQLLISGACSCTNTGGAFTFSVGNSYTVTLLSSRGSQFSYSVVRYS
jgi:archaeal type IV pilus assembly protein PilA